MHEACALQAKNASARKPQLAVALSTSLCAVWLNLHYVPPDKFVLEVRVKEWAPSIQYCKSWKCGVDPSVDPSGFPVQF
eukprot:1138818-Pelagomonas_calceolata.AAC.4